MSKIHSGSGGAPGGGPAAAGAVAQRAEPRSGDLVVARSSGADGPFMVRQVPGGAQFRTSTKTEAVHLARGFAQSHAVDIWYADRDAYRLLERYRPSSVAAGDADKGPPR